MKKLTILLFIFLLSGLLYAQVNVTVRINTSTNLDTINADNGFIELRGEATGTFPDGNTIAWGAASTLHLTNVGGDYWEVTFQMNPDDTLKYKAWTGFYDDQSVGTNPNGGWEGDFNESNGISGSNTRTFISGDNDTVLAVQYYHPSGTVVDQYWKPFESKTDSVAVYFRVSLAAQIEQLAFDPASNTVVVRGAPTSSPGGGLDWGQNRVTLTREEGSQFDGSFYSGAGYFAKDSVTEGANQEYKFVFQAPGDNWESIDNRVFTYPMGLKDTTLIWTYFSNSKPTGKETYKDVVITFRVSTEALKAIGLFDRGVGDYIEVRGPKGWDATEAIQLAYNSLLQEWTSTNETFDGQEGMEIAYKYYVGWDSSRIDTFSANYIPKLNIGQGWEEPAPTGGGNRIHVFQKTDHSVVGDFGFQRQFFDGVPANGVIDHDIDVTISIDMTNATNADSNSLGDLFVPGVDTVWAFWDGELTAWSMGLDLWFDDSQESRFLQLTDPEGDMIYTGTVKLAVDPPTFPAVWYQLGYRIAYSSANGYVRNGTGGAVRGRRYYQYIHPSEINEGGGLWPETVWPTEYTLPTLDWTEGDLYVEDPPNLTEAIVSIGKENLPYKFALNQNFPNPFNPTTTIRYSLAKKSDVKVTIYNMMGQEVRTLINGNMNAGLYELVWNGRNASNQKVASGVYLVKMVAGDFTQTRKMVLIR